MTATLPFPDGTTVRLSRLHRFNAGTFCHAALALGVELDTLAADLDWQTVVTEHQLTWVPTAATNPGTPVDLVRLCRGMDAVYGYTAAAIAARTLRLLAPDPLSAHEPLAAEQWCAVGGAAVAAAAAAAALGWPWLEVTEALPLAPVRREYANALLPGWVWADPTPEQLGAEWDGLALLAALGAGQRLGASDVQAPDSQQFAGGMIQVIPAAVPA